MRPSKTGTASMLQTITRLPLLLGPVLSSGPDLCAGFDASIPTNILEELPEIINIEDLTLNPKYLYADAPYHDNPLREADACRANTFICTKCGSTDANECILTKLGREIRQLVAKNECEKASKHFEEYLKHLNSHEKMPPTLPGDDIEIPLISLLEFIVIMIDDDDMDGSILISMLTKYKNMPPFQLKNIVVSDSDFLIDKESAGNNEIQYKRKLEDCNLRGISVLYEGYALDYCSSDEKEKIKAYNSVLINILFYSMNIQKLEVSKKRFSLSCNIAKEMEALKITDFMQFFARGFIPVHVLRCIDLTPYRDDESIFEAFRSEVQKIVKGRHTIEALYSLVSWSSIFRDNKMVEKALDHNFQISFKNLAKYLKAATYADHPIEDLNKLIRETRSVFPFKLENIIVSCSVFSQAEEPLFGKVRDSNRGITGHKKLSECSLLEAGFLLQFYELDEEKGPCLAFEELMGSLFWQELRERNISPAVIHKFLESLLFEKIRETLTGKEVLALFQRDLISFVEFFDVLVKRQDAYIIFKPLMEELSGAMERGVELKLWKELAKHKPESEFFEKSSSAFELSSIIKLLEVCTKDEDVMEMLSSNLFKIQRVLHFNLSNIVIDEKDMLRRRCHKYFMNFLPREISSRLWPDMFGDSKRYVPDCNMQEIVTIFNTYKSDNNEEVNKLFAYMLLCAVNIEEPLKEDISHKVPEYFFTYVHQLPSERLTKLIQAGIVPAKFLTNSPGLTKE